LIFFFFFFFLSLDNAVFFPDYSVKRIQQKEIEKKEDNSMSVDNKFQNESSDASDVSEDEIDIMDHIDKEKEQLNKKIYMRIPCVTSSDESSGSDD
jgi:hypothetical protein